MSDRITCYERDEDACEDQVCLRVGCKLRKERLGNEAERLALAERIKQNSDVYEAGYSAGEDSGYADWIMQLSEEFDLDDLEGPQDFIAKLRSAYDLTSKRS